MTQTEQIVWHEYPDEKPIERGYKLCEFYDVGGNLDIRLVWWNKEADDFSYWMNGIDIVGRVIAWAEMLKGWQDDTD